MTTEAQLCKISVREGANESVSGGHTIILENTRIIMFIGRSPRKQRLRIYGLLFVKIDISSL